MLLAIETATSVCGVALVGGGTIVAESWIDEDHVHSEKIISLIGETTERGNTSLAGIGAIAVSAGPGSFTGLRIGLSTAKGLAFALSAKLVAVPTLGALARSAVDQGFVSPGDYCLALIDARRKEVYAALYRCEGGGCREIMPACARRVDELEEMVAHPGGTTLVTGNGAQKYGDFLAGSIPQGVRFAPAGRNGCRAPSVGILGERMLERGETADLASTEPLYVKDFHTLVKTQHENSEGVHS